MAEEVFRQVDPGCSWQCSAVDGERPPLGKIIATLDFLSGGRANCGIGAAWDQAEHHAYGWYFPPTSYRYDLLEDTLRMLPLLWGKGSPRSRERSSKRRN